MKYFKKYLITRIYSKLLMHNYLILNIFSFWQLYNDNHARYMEIKVFLFIRLTFYNPFCLYNLCAWCQIRSIYGTNGTTYGTKTQTITICVAIYTTLSLTIGSFVYNWYARQGKFDWRKIIPRQYIVSYNNENMHISKNGFTKSSHTTFF